MAELSDQAKALLEQQRLRYINSLTDKHSALQALWQVRDQQLLELIDAVHRIAGSAGLHGLDQIQAQAVSTEQALRHDNATPQEQEEAFERLLKLLAETSPPTSGSGH